MPEDHPDRSGQLGNLGSALHLRFEATRDNADLVRAAELLKMAVRASEPGQADTAIQQIRLGQTLLELTWPVPAETFAEAIGNLRAAAGNAAARSDLRVDAARAWGQGAAQAQRWDLALAGYSAAIELLPLAAWHGLHRADRENQLASWPGLASDAAACALQAGRPGLAVELIEQGRSVVWGQMLRTKTDLRRLGDSHPEFSSKITEIRGILDQPEVGAIAESGAKGSARRDNDRRIRAARDWDALLQTIRALPGFEDFGQPVPFSQLNEAAADGPVVIVNVSRIRCDAMILTSSGLTVLPLENLSWDAAMTHGNTYLHAVQRLSGYGEEDLGRTEMLARLHEIDSTLAWLWRAVTEPVLTQLGYTSTPAAGKSWPRIWWSAAGPLSLLPIHAAGRYDDTARPVPASALDLVVSSYTPTLQALIRARKTGRAGPTGRRLLIVAVPPERWMPPPAAPLGPRRLGAGLLLLWLPLPPMA